MNNTKTQFYLLLTFLLFWLPYAGTAQKYLPYFQRFTLEDGLSSPYFNSFLQDSRGLIWLGANYGLNRYDGTAIRSYTKEDDGLCHNYVRGISEDGNGNLWILAGDYTRSQQFFCVFDPISEVFYTVEEYTGAPCPFDPSRTNLSPLYKGILLLSEETDSTYNIFEVDKNRLSLAFSISRSDSFYQSFVSNDIVKLDNGNFLATTVRYEQHVPHKTLFNSRGEILEDFPCWQTFGKDIQIAGDRLFYSCSEWWGIKEGLGIHSTPSIYIDGQKKGVIDPLSVEAVLPTKDHIYLVEEGRTAISIYDQGSLRLQQRVELEQKIANTSYYWFTDQEGGIWYMENNGICRLGFREQFFELPIQDDYSGKSKPIRGITTGPNGTTYTGGSLSRLYIHPRNEPKLETVVVELTSGGIMGLLYDEGVIWIALDSKKNLWRYSPETRESKFYDKIVVGKRK